MLHKSPPALPMKLRRAGKCQMYSQIPMSKIKRSGLGHYVIGHLFGIGALALRFLFSI